MDRLLSMRVFQKVADEGGFAAAARALNMSPAVVTRLVADLEEHLGTRLLHRSTRRISLSAAGETYLSRLRAIMQDIEEADLAVSSQTQGIAGTLRILTSPVLATYVLAPMVADFRAAFPNVILNIDVDASGQPKIEDYDVTLLRTTIGFDGDIIARKVSTTESILVGSPAYLARKGTPQTPAELADHEVLRLRVPGVPQRLWRLFDANDDQHNIEIATSPVLWVNHSEALLLACLGGAGITSVPVDLAAPYLARGELVRVLRPWIAQRLTTYAALPSRKFMPERTRLFLDFLVDWMREHQRHAMAACRDSANC